jgi:uncharacterized delta-60 repeat protein
MRILRLVAKNRVRCRRSLAFGLSLFGVVLPALFAGHASGGGGLDPGFGDGGIALNSLSGSDFSFAVALQPDGKIVTAGTSNYGFAVNRYNNDGTLDQTFGSAGTVLRYFGPYNLAYGLAIQPDGKILAAGYQQNGTGAEPDFAVTPLVVRYNPDGSPDSSFGSAGSAIVGQAPVESAKSVAIQPDGKIVVAGNRIVPTGVMRGPSQFAVSRLGPDGNLDPSFGSSGKITTSFNQVDFLNAIVLQPDGKIIAVGDSGAADTGETDGRSIAIARYNSDGALDPGFGAGGKIVTSMPGGAVGYGAALQPDGKLIVTGAGGSHLILVRYNRDGSLDQAFGTGGLISSVDGEGYSVAVESDGSILVGGSAAGGAVDDFAILMFNSDGSPDASFGTNGGAMMDIGMSAEGRAIAIEPGGRIIMSGYVQRNESSVEGVRFALLAYQPASGNRCMRDSGGGDYVLFNPDGHYKFALCGKTEMTLSGVGAVSLDGTALTITDRQADRVVKISYDTAASTGKAKIKMVMPDGVVPFSIKSTNRNAVCSCAAR